MKLLYNQPADFWRERDLGAKISAAFDFIGVHWRALGRCLVYFVLPPALLTGIGLGVFMNGLMGFAARAGSNPRLGAGSSSLAGFNFWALGLGALGFLVSIVLLSATVYGYLRVRLRLPPAEVVQPRHVWEAVRGRLLGVFGGSFLLFVGGYAGFFLVVGVVASGLAALNLGVGGVLLVMLLATVPLTYVLITLSLYFPVLWLEDQGIFGAIGRCFGLIKGQWWATFGLLFITGIIQGSLLFVFIIPQYAVTIGRAMHVPFFESDVLGIVAQCIYALGTMFVYTFPLLVLAFQLFHLVELRESLGSRLLLDGLGQPATVAAADPHENFYRPDEEGEY